MDKHNFSSQDITETKQYEEELLLQAHLLDKVYDPVIATDMDFSITYWNKAAERTYGWTAKEALGQNADALFQTIFVGSGLDEAIPRLMQEKSAEVEVIHKRMDGSRINVISTVSLLDDNNGTPIGTIGVLRDISDRKRAEEALQKSEEQLALLLKLSDTLRPISNPVKIHAAVTRAAMDWLSSDRCYYCEVDNDRAIIRHDASRGDLPSVAGEYPLNSLPIHKSLLEAGQPFVITDVRTTDMVDEELRQLCIQLKVISYLDVPVIKDGKLAGILCIVQSTPRNWTETEAELAVEIAERTWEAVERARTEEALLIAERNKNDALQKSIKMKDEFISLISHEFKTPLTVINSAVQTMKRICGDELSDKANRYLGMIMQNSNRQLKLVNNLLDITRINVGHLKIDLANVDIVHITRVITESINVFAQQKEINLLFSSSLGKKIIGIDEEKYERILLNLLSNAIKFTPRGKSIFVRVSQKVVNRKCNVCIEVKDQGFGIPEDKQQLIFERFGQVDSSLSRQAEGTGIGLSLVKMFVDIMGCEIALESKVGKGSKFTVLFPATKIKEAPEEKTLQEINDNRLIKATAIEFSDVSFVQI